MNNIKKIAVIGAGPAGLAASTIAAERGHNVTLIDAGSEIGGQFNIAKDIPGKEDFVETLRYYQAMLDKHQVDVKLNTAADTEGLRAEHYDDIIVATGVTPRKVDIPGADHPMVLRYDEVVLEKKPVGKRVAIVGAGGIGFDIAEFLLHHEDGLVRGDEVVHFLAEGEGPHAQVIGVNALFGQSVQGLVDGAIGRAIGDDAKGRV